MSIKLLDKMPAIEKEIEKLIKGFENDSEPSKVIFKKFSHADKAAINLLTYKITKLQDLDAYKKSIEAKENKTIIHFVSDIDEFVKLNQELNYLIIKASVVSMDGIKIENHKNFYDNIQDIFVINELTKAAQDFNDEAGVAAAAKN
jgi:soluble cytochrome b562